MIHCARLVCSSATGPSPTAQVQHSHWSPGNSGSHPSWGWMSQQYRGFWISRLLEFPVLISNRVPNRSGTDISAQTTLFHCHNQSLQQPSENQEGYPHLTFQRPWSTVGFPTLRFHTYQGAELESKPVSAQRSQYLPLTPELVLLPMCLCHFNYMWRKNSLV